MAYFNNIKQDNFKADFGFDSPHRTKSECVNPVFADKKLHRIAMMKVEHLGSEGDKDENGIKGWIAKRVCTGCGNEYKRRVFYEDKKP